MSRRPPRPESLLPLKPNWLHILLCLVDREQHGYAIMQEVLARTDRRVRLWPATLYGTIRRLLDADLIEESEERPDPAFDDLRRHYYRLTPFGRRVLAAESARLEALVRLLRAKDAARDAETAS